MSFLVIDDTTDWAPDTKRRSSTIIPVIRHFIHTNSRRKGRKEYFDYLTLHPRRFDLIRRLTRYTGRFNPIRQRNAD
jgi:hypothetical protein